MYIVCFISKQQGEVCQGCTDGNFLLMKPQKLYRYQDGLCVWLWLWLKLTYCSEIFQETVREGNVSQGYQD